MRTPNTSCNACIRIADRHGVRIGMKLPMRGGLTGEVAAITHLDGEPHCLVAAGSADTLIVPMRALANRICPHPDRTMPPTSFELVR